MLDALLNKAKDKMIEYKRGPLDYSKTINPVNVGVINAKMFCIVLNLSKIKKRKNLIWISVYCQRQLQDLYNVEKFKEWFNKNKWVLTWISMQKSKNCCKNKYDRKVLGLPKI